MKNIHDINKLVEDTMNSMDQHDPAEPMPFLLTRIRARLGNQGSSAWDRFGSVISRPVVALGGVVILIMLNVLVITSGNRNNNIATEQPGEFITSTAAFEIENMLP
jgi:hypothetical protein